jgi:6-phosphogluconate dehydrogenase
MEASDMASDKQQGCDLGLVGLGVMGAALADNLHRHGARLAGLDQDPGRLVAFAASPAGGAGTPCGTMPELVAALAPPRKVLLMVSAGEPVDTVLAELTPLLEPGDLLLDGGNSHWADTERRLAETRGKGLAYLGLGISGGEQGALHGPSIMAGGPEEAWEQVRDLLEQIAARADDQPCVARLGHGGAGHYAKMVHNGIEYAEMQLIAEVYQLLRQGAEMSLERLAACFESWSQGPLASYLVQITATILGHRDPGSGQPLLDLIADESRHKGTGRWACETALGLGVPVPTLQAAVEARYLSALGEQRRDAAGRLPGPGPDQQPLQADEDLLATVADALWLARLVAFAQGFALLAGIRDNPGYDIDGATVARIWRAGCILRGPLLERIAAALDRAPRLPSLLLDEDLGADLQRQQQALRRVTTLAAERGIPVPALASALAYYDSYRCARLPANLTAAQRDYFGAHGFGRTDRPGEHHGGWPPTGDGA